MGGCFADPAHAPNPDERTGTVECWLCGGADLPRLVLQVVKSTLGDEMTPCGT